jgi:hypothetical protein
VIPSTTSTKLNPNYPNLNDDFFSVYLLIRLLGLLAGCRLPAGKQGDILTSFKTKVNKKKDENCQSLTALSLSKGSIIDNQLKGGKCGFGFIE